MIGTDPTVIAVTKIDRAARALRATSVDHDDVLRRLVAIAPDHVVAAIVRSSAMFCARAGLRPR